MPVFQSAITVNIKNTNDWEDQVAIVASLTDGPDPVWEMRRDWTAIRFRSRSEHSYKDAIWMLYDLLYISREDLKALPAAGPAYDIEERRGYEYCMARRERTAEKMAACPYIFRLYTFPGADLVGAASMVHDLQQAGANIILTTLTESTKLVVPDVSGNKIEKSILKNLN